MSKASYHRVLIKVSGEALAGDKHTGIDVTMLDRVAGEIKACHDAGVEVAVVTGGGNFWRGIKDGGPMERTRADHVGMLATVMNCIALSEALERAGVPSEVMTAVPMPAMCTYYTQRDADKLLKQGKVVLLGCGTGWSYFSTDTGAILRGTELHCDVIMLAKNVDGVYDKDPGKNPDAKRLDRITFAEILAKELKVIDSTAASLSLDNEIPVLLFALKDPHNIYRACMGESIGTLVTKNL